MTQPIDYARAVADVVRKKFRRRVAMFVIATVVVMVIGVGWILNPRFFAWLIGDIDSPVSVAWSNGSIRLCGPKLTADLNSGYEEYGNRNIGVWMWRNWSSGHPRWVFAAKFRTLFILAMIPWIITLIRMIRIWKRNRVFETEPRTE